jgi:MerR family transcriptional regulator, redox-sensitive transcriptional activator SoxR
LGYWSLHEITVQFQVNLKSNEKLLRGGLMVTLNIGELARKVGIQTSAIRYYEEIGLMPSPPRIGGWRSYESSMVNRLQIIHTAREIGFSIEEIRTLLNGFPQATSPSERWRKLAEDKLPEITGIIARATALKDLLEAGLNCKCEDIDLCLSTRGDSCLDTKKSCTDSS